MLTRFSGWSRMSVLPLLALAIWSRIWIGWWSLLPIGVTIFWMWLNPRAFPIPQSTSNWMSKGVLGERVWLRHYFVITSFPSLVRLSRYIWPLFSIQISSPHFASVSKLIILGNLGLLSFGDSGGAGGSIFV